MNKSAEVTIMIGTNIIGYQSQLKIEFKSGKWCGFNINEEVAELIYRLIDKEDKKEC